MHDNQTAAARHLVAIVVLRRFLVARLSLSVLPFVPYTLLYALHYGVSVSATLLAEAAFEVFAVVLDIPCGIFADRLGRSVALSLTGGIQLICCLLLFLDPGAFAFWATQPLWAIAAALSRGADSGAAHDILERHGVVDSFEFMEQRYLVVYSYTSALIFALSLFVVKYGYKYVFLETACIQVVAIFLLVSLPKSPAHALPASSASLIGPPVIRGLLHDARGNPGGSVLLLSLIFFSTALLAMSFYMPALLTVCGVPGIYAGPVFALSGVSAGLISSSATRRNWAISGLSVAGAALGIGFFPTHSVVLLVGGYTSCLVAQISVLPKARNAVLAAMPNRGKAEALSFVTVAGGLGFALVAFPLSVLIKETSIDSLAVVCSGLLAGSWVILRASERCALA